MLMRTLVLALVLLARTAADQSGTPVAPPLPYDTIFYPHDGLQLEAYLYKPQGTGPFPLVVYNHGSALPAEEAQEWPVPFIARLLVPAGYAVLVPERRGYGKSEGRRFSEEIGADRGPAYVARMQAEAGDVNAAVEHVLTLPGASIDTSRVAIMGWSFGGIVTTLAASRSSRFAAAAVQAPGALNWERSENLRTALIQAAGKIKTPLQCVVAENDATTASAREICAAAAANGARTAFKIYPPFAGGNERPGNPPGHALFGRLGVNVWDKDLLAFLSDALRR